MIDQFILTPLFLDEPLPGLETIAEPDWIINKPTLLNGDKQTRITAVNRELANVVAETISAGKRPVSIAGDCLGAIGVLTGLQRAGVNPFLVWFDAHGDFNTWETSPSGFLGGMPLAMIVGRGDQRIPRGVGLAPFPESRVLLTDARDLDPGERISLQRSAVIHCPDPNRVVGHAFPDSPLYIHVDTDIISPVEAPAMNYPAPGGPSVIELKAVFRQLAMLAPIVAVSVSSWNPELDPSRRTEKASLDALDALIGSE